MHNILQRTLTGVIYIIIIIGSILWSSIAFALVFLVLTTLCLLEFYKLVENNTIQPQKITGTIVGIVFFILHFVFFYFPFLSTFYDIMLLIITLLFFIIFVVELFRNKSNPFINIAFTFLGIIYVVFPLSLLNLIGMYPNTESYQPYLLLSFFCLHWANDTGAYLIGVNFGKHRLFKRISPLKSWEGAIGGMMMTLVTAYFISIYFTQINLINWIIIASIIAVFGILGDLVESMFKRELNIKDSGTVLPGHGGLLDRFDGILLSAPFLFAYMIFIQN